MAPQAPPPPRPPRRTPPRARGRGARARKSSRSSPATRLRPWPRGGAAPWVEEAEPAPDKKTRRRPRAPKQAEPEAAPVAAEPGAAAEPLVEEELRQPARPPQKG